MLRSLFSGISGLRAHQTMLDVTGNNIANVNTTGFKASQTQFQDTLSQVLTNAGASQDGLGGTNAAQVGLGVRIAGITTNFQQGAAQLTNRSTDMMISGDGFFVVRKGADQFYSRAGAFDFDSTGQLVTPDGGLVQGWAADASGVIDPNGPLVDMRLPIATLMGAAPSTAATFEGNLPADAALGTTLVRKLDVFDAAGNVSDLELTYTKTAAGWDVAGAIDAATATGAMTFNPDGTLATGGTLTVGAVTVDLSTITDAPTLKAYIAQALRTAAEGGLGARLC